MGVFDGVGAWAAKGHDPGIFTRGFAEAVAGDLRVQASVDSRKELCIKSCSDARNRSWDRVAMGLL